MTSKSIMKRCSLNTTMGWLLGAPWLEVSWPASISMVLMRMNWLEWLIKLCPSLWKWSKRFSIVPMQLKKQSTVWRRYQRWPRLQASSFCIWLWLGLSSSFILTLLWLGLELLRSWRIVWELLNIWRNWLLSSRRRWTRSWVLRLLQEWIIWSGVRILVCVLLRNDERWAIILYYLNDWFLFY